MKTVKTCEPTAVLKSIQLSVVLYSTPTSQTQLWTEVAPATALLPGGQGVHSFDEYSSLKESAGHFLQVAPIPFLRACKYSSKNENPEKNGNKKSKEFLQSWHVCAIVSLKFNCICIETDVLRSETSPYAAQTPTRIATAQFVGCEHGGRNLKGFAIQVVTWQRLEIVTESWLQHLPHHPTTCLLIRWQNL